MKEHKNKKLIVPKRDWFHLWRISRFIVYIFGIVTLFWYFWCVIGLVIGIFYFIFLKDNAWKRNGIILAGAIGFITFFVHFYKGLAPLITVIYFSVGFIISYAILLLILEILKRKEITIKKIVQCHQHYLKLSNKSRKVIELSIALIPISFWTSVSIDLGVMFDNNPRLLWVNTPTMVKIDESFDITVEAWDSYERLSAVYKGKVEFSIISYNLTNYNQILNPQVDLPEPYTFTGQFLGSDIAYEIRDGKDNGIHVFQATIMTPGIHYILVDDSITENTYYSNPIIVKNFSFSDPLIVWGDIHTHSQLSDGTSIPQHSFYYARHIACLDFNALTDHGEIMRFSPFSLD
ncbi:MAG: hypothetical protein ACFFB0_12220 [Promethearchaeota archaeon]